MEVITHLMLQIIAIWLSMEMVAIYPQITTIMTYITCAIVPTLLFIIAALACNAQGIDQEEFVDAPDPELEHTM
jgi:hypothetical protein